MTVVIVMFCQLFCARQNGPRLTTLPGRSLCLASFASSTAPRLRRRGISQANASGQRRGRKSCSYKIRYVIRLRNPPALVPSVTTTIVFTTRRAKAVAVLPFADENRAAFRTSACREDSLWIKNAYPPYIPSRSRRRRAWRAYKSKLTSTNFDPTHPLHIRCEINVSNLSDSVSSAIIKSFVIRCSLKIASYIAMLQIGRSNRQPSRCPANCPRRLISRFARSERRRITRERRRTLARRSVAGAIAALIHWVTALACTAGD